jgi:glycosyltransferase involved in cell wall biosynthesis
MVNDCSTDGSDKIIDEYAEKYDCCVAIHHETNSGGAHTPRNTGIEASTGDYIMFLDPDDRYTPDACEVLYNTIKGNDVDLAFARFRRIFEYGGVVQKSYSGTASLDITLSDKNKVFNDNPITEMIRNEKYCFTISGLSLAKVQILFRT